MAAAAAAAAAAAPAASTDAGPPYLPEVPPRPSPGMECSTVGAFASARR